MQVTVNRPSNTTPICFSKEWDGNDPECAGGADANYTDPVTGQHVRQACIWFHSCGIRAQAMRNAAAQPALGRSTQGALQLSPLPPQATFADHLRQQEASRLEAMRQTALMRPVAQTAVVGTQFANYPASTYQLNYVMPGYLTVPEVQQPGEGLMAVLLREFVRALIKAGAHAVSHFADVRLFKSAPTPIVNNAPPPPPT